MTGSHMTRGSSRPPANIRSAVLLLLIMLIGRPCLGSEPSTYQVLDVVVSPAVFDEIVDLVTPEDAARVAAVALFDRYSAAAQELERQTYARMLDHGLAEAVELSRAIQELEMNRRDRHEYTRLFIEYQKRLDACEERTRIPVQLQRRDGLIQSDRLLADFLADLGIALAIKDELTVHVERMVRRSAYLHAHPFQPASDFGMIPDLLDVVDAAAIEGGELHRALAPHDSAVLAIARLSVEPPAIDAQEAQQSEKEQIIQLLAAYERSIDSTILSEMRRLRQHPQFLARAAISSDDPDFAEHMTSMADRWSSYFDPLWSHATSISQVLLSMNDSCASQMWIRRVQRGICPDLSAERWPSTMTDWVDSLPDATEELRQSVSVIQSEYCEAYAAALRQAFASGVQLRRKQFLLDFGQTTDLDRRYARDRLNMHRISSVAVRRLRDLLSPTQAARLQDALCDPSHGLSSKLGPRIESTVLSDIDPEGRYRDSFDFCAVRHNSAN